MPRRTAILPAVLLVSVVLSGCIGGSSETDETVALATFQNGSVSEGEAAWWAGRTLFADPQDSACGADNCERLAVDVGAAAAGKRMQVALGWTHLANTGDHDYEYPNFDLRVFDPQGNEVARSALYKFGALAHVDGVQEGDYTIQVLVRHLMPQYFGEYFVPQYGNPDQDANRLPVRGDYHGRILFHDEVPASEGADLPDLIVHMLDDLRLEPAPYGGGHGFPLPTAPMPGTVGCTQDEATLEGSTRCLRFSVGLGNMGTGRLDLRYNTTQESAVTEAPVPAVQCVTNGSGGELRSAGQGNFHALHYHDHQRDILTYELFDATNEEPLRTGAKFGYGFFRQGLVHDGRVPVPTGEWFNDLHCPLEDGQSLYGLPGGWFDIYQYWRTGQYIDIAGVPDGTYTLLVTVNPEGVIHETDATNNVARLTFELSGEQVQVLEAYRSPAEA